MNLIQSVRKTKQPLQNSTNTPLGDVIEEPQVLSDKLSEIESLHREITELKLQNSKLIKQVEKLEVDKDNLESVNQNLIGTGLFIFTCFISIYFWIYDSGRSDENETFRIQLKLHQGLNLDESQLTPCPSADNSMDPEALENLIYNMSLVG